VATLNNHTDLRISHIYKAGYKSASYAFDYTSFANPHQLWCSTQSAVDPQASGVWEPYSKMLG
jgi:hypothetical protein